MTSSRDSAKWPICIFLSVLVISMASCTAWVDGKRAETACERVR